ncbi:MAG: lipopolysaccharide biosynthesis protein [Acidimicrobiia bacterium]|nr:lipopolysaccharide biosynthesis protein [Acidimicrobiia bacterium]
MTDNLAEQAGSAIIWKAIQLVGVKGLSMGRLLVLAVILAPEDWGLVAIGAVTTELLVALTDVGINDAIIQKKDVEDRHYDTAFTVGIIRGILIAAVVALLAPWIAALFDEPDATAVIRVLAFRPLVDALASAKVIELTRTLKFRPLTFIKLPAALAETAGIFVVLVLPAFLVDSLFAIGLARTLGVWALVIGAFAGSISGVVLSYRLAPYRPRFSLVGFRELFSFGKWVFATRAVRNGGQFGLRAVVSRFLGSEDLGRFYLAQKITVLPNDLVSEVVRGVAFPVLSRVQHSRSRTSRVFKATLTAMLTLLVPIYVTLFVFAEALVRHVLPSSYAGLAIVIQILAIDGIIDLLTDALKPMLRGQGRPRTDFAFTAVRTVLLVGLAIFLTDQYGLAGAAWAWFIAEAVIAVLAVAIALNVLKRPFEGMARVLFVIVASASVGAGLGWLLAESLGGVFGLALGSLSSLVLGLMILLAFDRRFDYGLIRDFNKAFPKIAKKIGFGELED